MSEAVEKEQIYMKLFFIILIGLIAFGIWISKQNMQYSEIEYEKLDIIKTLNNSNKKDFFSQQEGSIMTGKIKGLYITEEVTSSLFTTH